MKLNCQPPGQWNYNSRPRVGANFSSRHWDFTGEKLQLTPRDGANQHAVRRLHNAVMSSTHAPVRGRTHRRTERRHLLHTTTHAPVRGRTPSDRLDGLFKQLQLTPRDDSNIQIAILDSPFPLWMAYYTISGTILQRTRNALAVVLACIPVCYSCVPSSFFPYIPMRGRTSPVHT